jgi:hypothetical protein
VTDPVPAAAEPLRFEHSFTTGPDYPSKVTRAVFRYLLLTRRRLVLPIIILVVVALVGVTQSVSGTPSIFVPVFLVVYVVFYVLIYGVGFATTVRRTRARIPAGSVFSVGFRSETLAVRSPQVSSEVAYSYYRAAERRGAFVLLRQRATRASSLLPGELFTDESLAYLQSRIGAPTA